MFWKEQSCVAPHPVCVQENSHVCRHRDLLESLAFNVRLCGIIMNSKGFMRFGRTLPSVSRFCHILNTMFYPILSRESPPCGKKKLTHWNHLSSLVGCAH